MRSTIRRWVFAATAALVLPTVVAPAGRAIGQDDADVGQAWDRFDAAFTALAPSTSFLAAEVMDGECRPVHGSAPDRRVAIASTFKLYVLGELARQVEAGLASWDEKLAVQERLKSLPSGNMMYEPAGTKRTLRHFAERMIADSDNTATDHLIDRLGRKNVEAALAAFGHGAPEMNVPLLTTRELFTFKIAMTPERVDAYLAAQDDEQRRILETVVDPISLPRSGYGDWVAPKRIDSIEWFASAREVCRVLATLHEMTRRPGLDPIAEILELNRGAVFDARTWPDAGFKGGYEAGVFNLTWLLRRMDGRWFVVTAGLNDPVSYIDQHATKALMLGVADLLADWDRGGSARNP